jgi:hypothetical protein
MAPWFVYAIIATPAVTLCSLLWYVDRKLQAQRKGSGKSD